MLALFNVSFHLYLQKLTIAIVEEIARSFLTLHAAHVKEPEKHRHRGSQSLPQTSQPCRDKSRSAPIGTRHSTLRTRPIVTPPALLTMVLEPQGLCPGFIRRRVSPSPPFAPGPRSHRP